MTKWQAHKAKIGSHYLVMEEGHEPYTENDDCHFEVCVSWHPEGGKIASLIAAAPELLEIIQQEVNAYPSGYSTDPNKTEWLNKARELITKATNSTTGN